MNFLRIFVFLLALLYPSLAAVAAEVLFIDTPNESAIESAQINLAARFYGLGVRQVIAEEGKQQLETLLDIKDVSTGIVITARALPLLTLPPPFKLGQENQAHPSIFIMGITPETDVNVLRQWSNNTVTGCERIDDGRDIVISAADNNEITRELSGLRNPLTKGSQVPDYAFTLDDQGGGVKLMEATSGHGAYPIFVMTPAGGGEVFFMAGKTDPEVAYDRTTRPAVDQFCELAPIMMFLRHVYGERVWHGPADFANLTIDDPWLREPYGFLSFQGLLQEMEKINFHTTIAFVPWNFDRSKKEVVSLFQGHPERFSLGVHGNNHDHREFYRYASAVGDPTSAKSLGDHKANIKQALTRMEEFRKKTGLPYDRVMVFPHAIAPAPTLGLLKAYNFLATANGTNIPLDASAPEDPLFGLQTVSVDFENFPSLKRNSLTPGFYATSMQPLKPPEDGPIPRQAQIAMDLFLDNPVLFFTHQEFFGEGISAFNDTAAMVNMLQPRVRWAGLGEIARHLYRERLRDDGRFDIQALANDIVIKNDRKQPATYVVQKAESFQPPIKRLTVDGNEYPFEKNADSLMLTLTIPAGESREVLVEYENDYNPTAIDTNRKDLRIFGLRIASDFRDLYLSKNSVVRVLLPYYYSTGFYKFGLAGLAVLGLSVTVPLLLLGRRILKR